LANPNSFDPEAAQRPPEENKGSLAIMTRTIALARPLAPALALPVLAWRYKKVLAATSQIELRQKYAGSLLGSVWIILYPLILLGIYLFLYLVIFKMRFPGYSELNYVVFVFSGLIPYLFLMESLGRGAVIIRENMHLLRNVIVPPELVVVRLVLVAMMGQVVSFAVLLALIALDGDFTWRILFLPVVLLFAVAFLVGITFFVASLGAIFSDVSSIINLLLLFLLFVSPLAFQRSMVPANLQLIVDLNPLTYFFEAFRWTLLNSYPASALRVLVFPILSLAVYAAGTAFFRNFKGLMVDHV
jgi:lipopolysaccharide transport system permease protein